MRCGAVSLKFYCLPFFPSWFILPQSTLPRIPGHSMHLVNTKAPEADHLGDLFRNQFHDRFVFPFLRRNSYPPPDRIKRTSTTTIVTATPTVASVLMPVLLLVDDPELRGADSAASGSDLERELVGVGVGTMMVVEIDIVLIVDVRNPWLVIFIEEGADDEVLVVISVE